MYIFAKNIISMTQTTTISTVPYLDGTTYRTGFSTPHTMPTSFVETPAGYMTSEEFKRVTRADLDVICRKYGVLQ